MGRIRLILVCFVGLAWSTVCLGQLFEEDFNVDPTASWTVNDPALSDVFADFFYDYSSIGVPAAPNGSGTRGLKMTANNSGGVFSGFSVSPTAESFTGDYRVSFDLWQNYVGPLGAGGSGSTQLSMFGVATAGNVAVWPGSAPKESVGFAVTLDGGSASDYRVYSSVAPTVHPDGDPVYTAPGGDTNGSNAYYAGFGGGGAPAAQIGLFAGQTGSTEAGEIAFAWRRIVIEVTGDQATWFVDGLQIASIDMTTLTLGGSNIFFGHSDTNAGSSTDANDSLLNVTLVDNVLVEEIDGAAGNRATFEVTKEFTDGDNPTEVDVTINCFTGLPIEQSQAIDETHGVEFVVTSFDDGELDCEITEESLSGYTPTYNSGGPGSYNNDGGCNFEDVTDDSENTCHVVNDADPVDVVIDKSWVIEGSGGDQIDTSYKLTLYCNAEIADASYCHGDNVVESPEGINGNWTCKKNFYGDDSEVFTAQVTPEYPSSHCWVEEEVYDSSVEIDNDCGNLVISAGNGASCLITNSVFFEGIPTLNQYGLAILALLMMGAGLVGFRRFA